jgi:2-aminoethylphosphonate-pyruvate transaminase
MTKIKRNILLNPGPATTTDTVKNALVVPDICPREAEFAEVLGRIRRDLVTIVAGDDTYTSVLFSGSGTAVMDSVVSSAVPKNKKILVIVNGAYGERFVKIAGSYKISCVPVHFAWDQEIDAKTIEEVIRKDSAISCIAIVHHETTTGVLNPLNEIGALAKKYQCTFIVDAISSFAGIPLDIKATQADFLLSTSNKCIQGIAGIAFVICKKSALESIKSYEKRSFYLDLYNQYQYLEETGQTPFTIPVQVAYALDQAIREYFEEGGEQRYLRYTENWKVLRSGLLEMGFTLLLPKERESHILLTVLEPEDPNFAFDRMHDYLYERGFTIYPGKIRQKSFRLATMGAIYPEDIRAFLRVLKQYLARAHITLKAAS